MKPCSHCGKLLSNNWEDHFSSSDIKIRISSSIDNHLWLHKAEMVSGKHPAVTEGNGQYIHFQWGRDYDPENKNDYALCWRCSVELVEKIGSFFREDIALNFIPKIVASRP
jgi:hypothetical protein